MNIFESLENLQISEACFDEIMDMVEELLNEEGFLDKVTDKITRSDNKVVSALRKTPIIKNTIGKRAVLKAQDNLRQNIKDAQALTNNSLSYDKKRNANHVPGYKDAGEVGKGYVNMAKDRYLHVGNKYGYKENELLK